MRGIENYVLDDFIEQLLKPIKALRYPLIEKYTECWIL